MSAAGLLAACEPAQPSAAGPSTPVQAPPELFTPAEPGPEMAYVPMDPAQGDSEEARRQAEEKIRELDRSAATVGSDIAEVRQRAEEAYRSAAPRPPELPPPAPATPAPAAPTSAPPPAQTAPSPPPAPPPPTTPSG